MKTISGGPVRLGQSMTYGQFGAYGQNYSSPYGNVAPPPAAPPAPPELLPSRPVEVDDATRKELLDIIRTSKQQRRNIDAWWGSHQNVSPASKQTAQEILGAKLPEFQKKIAASMAYDELVDTLEFRLGVPGMAFVKDSELKDLKAYQSANDQLVKMIEVKSAEPLPQAPGDPKDIIMAGGVAVGAFLLSALI